MARHLIRTTLTSTLVLTALASSCGLSSDQSAIQLETTELALEVANFTIGTDTPVPEQYDTGNYPSVAAGGDQRLAVFEDGGRIRGVRFDKTGHVLDLEWLDFGIADRVQLYPSVAFGGDRYLVVWSEHEDSGSSIYGQVVSLDGKLQGERQLLTPGFDAQVCWLGDAFVLSWSDYGANLARVDTSGALIANSVVKVSAGEVTSVTRPLIAASDSTGMVVFSEDDGTRRNIRVARFNASAEVLDPGGLVINPTVQGTSEYGLAATNDRSLVTFKDESNLLKGSLVLADGTLGAAEFEITTQQEIAGHAAGSDGTTFAVVWDCASDAARELCAVNVASDGSVDPTPSLLGGGDLNAFQAMTMDMAFDDGAYAVVFEGIGVIGKQFSSDFDASAAPLELSALPNAQNVPFSGWNGEHYVVSWNDERGDSFQSRAVRVSKEGRVLDPEGIAISPDGLLAFSSAAATNKTGTTAFVFSANDQESALFRTMNVEGELTDNVVLSDGNPQGVDVVSNGSNFLVGYQVSPDITSSISTLYIHPTNEAGVLQGERIAIVPEFSRPRVTMVAQGQDYLLAYSGQAQEGTPLDGKVIRVSATGEMLAELTPASGGNPFLTAAGNSAGQVIFGWNNYETQELWFRILSGDTWSDAELLTTQPSEEAPSFVWDGQRFVSVWVESRNALWTRNVAVDGALGEESVAFSGDHTWPKLTLGAGPELLLTSVHWELFSRTRRIESRFVGADGVALPSNPIELDATDDTTDAPTSTATSTANTNTSSTTRPPSDPESTATSAAATSTAAAVAPAPTNGSSSSGTTANPSSEEEDDETDTDDGEETAAPKKSSDGCTIGTANGSASDRAWWPAIMLAAFVSLRRRAR